MLKLKKAEGQSLKINDIARRLRLRHQYQQFSNQFNRSRETGMKPPESAIKAFQHISGEPHTPSAKCQLRAGKRLSSLEPDVMLRIEKPHWVKQDNTWHNICLVCTEYLNRHLLSLDGNESCLKRTSNDIWRQVQIRKRQEFNSWS